MRTAGPAAPVQPSTPRTASTAPMGGWPAVTSVAVLCFLLVLSEFLPIGLLPEISAGVGISTGTAGLMIVTPGLAAAVTAPLVTIAAGRRDRRHVLATLAGLLAVSNALVAVAPNLGVLLLARVLLGVGVGGFWALGIGIAVRLVPADAVHRASSLITAGISAATVISLPLGALIGHLVGWRTGFIGAAVAALLALVSLLALLPALPPSVSVRMATLSAAARDRGVRRVALATALVFLGHFAGYTYITPYLQESAHFGYPAITAILLGYGTGGLVGNFAAGAALSLGVRRSFIAATVPLAVAVALLAPLADVAPVVIGLVVLWGVAFGAVPLILQTWMAQAATGGPEGGMAILVSAVQVSVAAGSFAGGVLVDGVGTGATFAVATALILFSAVVPLRTR